LVDLGCGGGCDLLFAAWGRPAPERLVGVENSPKLRKAGTELLARFPAAAAKITLRAGDFNHPAALDLPPVDLLLMNGSFNLVFDKPALLAAVAARLEPGGRLLLYDFLLLEPLPEDFAAELDNWLWNIGGALTRANLQQIANAAGLTMTLCRELERIPPVARAEIILQKP
jgi:SAM-dependent methyltransferase